MEVAYQVNRRKACDLCFLKKIKCDMIKPPCSNCQHYKAECRTTRVRKRLGPIGKLSEEADEHSTTSLPAAGVENGDIQYRIKDVESRLTRIEQRMGQDLIAIGMADPTDWSQTRPSSRAALPTPMRHPSGFEHTSLEHSDYTQTHALSGVRHVAEMMMLEPSAPVTNGIDAVVSDPYPRLPPLAEIQPTIDEYFTHVNSLIPLFSRPAFTRMLHDYYNHASPNPKAAWASVNVVLALAHRLPILPSNDIDGGFNDSQVTQYVNNAQSIVSELVTRHADLLSLQVVVGLVIIFNSRKDASPAAVLIGIAVRLSHRLRLQEHQQGFESAEALQRSRVFWVIYLFDKDICLRHHTPSAQNDADIDLDFPSENPSDHAGNMYSKGGRARTNFFCLRLRLAQIQGRVYDLLFSTRATKITPQERQARITLLHNQLEQWRLAVPDEFQVNVAMKHVDRTALSWLCMMHFSYLGCLVMIHGIWSHDAEWRRRLTSRDLQLDDTTEAVDRSQLGPSLPAGWKNCVQMSRHCMTLMYRMPLSDCSIWANGCAYFSALLILQANLCEYPLHETADTDLHLTSVAIGIFDKMNDASIIMQMKRMSIIAAELDRRVRLVIHHARLAASSRRLGVSPTGSVLPTTTSFSTSAADQNLFQWNWSNSGVEAWQAMDVSIELKR